MNKEVQELNEQLEIMHFNWQKEVGLMKQKHLGEMIENSKELIVLKTMLEELNAEVERLKMENLNLKEALKASQNN